MLLDDDSSSEDSSSDDSDVKSDGSDGSESDVQKTDACIAATPTIPELVTSPTLAAPEIPTTRAVAEVVDVPNVDVPNVDVCNNALSAGDVHVDDQQNTKAITTDTTAASATIG